MAQTRCDEPGCGAKSPSPRRFGWMRTYKVGHADEAKWWCPVHIYRGGHIDRPFQGKPGRKPKDRTDTWHQGSGRPLD